MTKEEFIIALQELGIELSDIQLQQLDKFYHLLIDWNQKINLTRITTEEDVYLKHFYDSLTIVKEVDLKTVNTLCDVGTGAGFPGIVLKIVFPNLDITLIDSLQKRITYLNDIIDKLNLKKIQALHTRGEDFHQKFDVVTARAVANIEKLLKYTMHLVNKNGVLIAMKGNVDEEITPLVEKSINQNYQLLKITKFLLPKEESNRSLVVIKNK